MSVKPLERREAGVVMTLNRVLVGEDPIPLVISNGNSLDLGALERRQPHTHSLGLRVHHFFSVTIEVMHIRRHNFQLNFVVCQIIRDSIRHERCGVVGEKKLLHHNDVHFSTHASYSVSPVGLSCLCLCLCGTLIHTHTITKATHGYGFMGEFDFG